MVLAVAATLACGTTTSNSARVSGVILLDENWANKTVDALVGQIVRVQLTESFPVPGSSLTWDVSSNAPGVLKLDKVTRDPAERPRQGTVTYTAYFSAVGSGEAKLFARGSQTCEAMPTCPQKDFTVTVDVSRES